MKNVFLGPLLHWIIIVTLIALGWIGGIFRFHVIEFNPFVTILILVVVLALILVLRTSRPELRITRDPVSDHTDDGSEII